MNNFFDFLKKNLAIILFVIFEIFAFSLTYQNKIETKNFVLNTSNALQSFVYSKIFKIQYYLHLSSENEKLFKLYTNLVQKKFNSNNCFSAYLDKKDTNFIFIPAWIIQNTTVLQNNYFTVNVGKKQGVRPEAAVVSPNGIVGIITNVANNYSVGLSVLNKINGFSAKIKKNDYFGAIIWDGTDYKYLILTEIPNHVKIKKGDTIVTSGYDNIFPPNYPVGTIDTFYKNSQDNFFTIKVKLFEDLKKTTAVFVVINKHKNEISEIQHQINEILQ